MGFSSPRGGSAGLSKKNPRVNFLHASSSDTEMKSQSSPVPPNQKEITQAIEEFLRKGGKIKKIELFKNGNGIGRVIPVDSELSVIDEIEVPWS